MNCLSFLAKELRSVFVPALDRKGMNSCKDGNSPTRPARSSPHGRCTLSPPRATGPSPRPKVHDANRRHAPKKAPCPHCGQAAGRRKGFYHRVVRSIAYQAIFLLHVTTAEYRTCCGCCTTFRTQIDGIEPKPHYDNEVREAVLDRLLDDRMSLRQIQRALLRDFYLDLSDGFLYDCLDWKIRHLDDAAYRRWSLVTAEKFAKMIALLRSPVGCRVRTNNHVERTNRLLRLYEKNRYKWCRGRTKVRFV
jgi:hypothetical protein